MPFDMQRPTWDQVKALLGQHQLLEDPLINEPISGDPDKGLYQFGDLSTVLKAYLVDRFLRLYLKEFPPSDPEWCARLRTGLESCLFALAREMTVLSLHPFIMKRHFDVESEVKTVSLGKLTEVVCSRENENFDRKRLWVREKVALPLHDIMVCKVMEVRRDKLLSFQIGAGEAALHFHHLVYKPVMLKRLRRFRDDLDNLEGV
jgi:hypothetical protein